MTTPTQKTCHGVLLSADAFAANKSNPDGLQRYCRDCQSTMRADWTKRNAEKIEADLKKRRDGRAARRGDVGEVITGDGTGKRLPAVSQEMRAARVEGLPASTRLDSPHDAQPRSGAGSLAELAHSAIVASLTNPRKHFDHAFIQELAESIRKQGVAAPILVRPLPGSRVGETYTDRRKDAPRPTHEIVAGEQRWRACAIAGVRTVPALIRNLTDEQVLELQLVENLKRRDLHPMEEAEGYERLRAVTGITADDIAERIGKGRSYVYKTLKLLELEPEARTAFYDGKLTRSTAELVAMRPPNLQLELLNDITATDYRGETMSYRAAKAHVENKFMLKLGTAPFKITDETLLPAAGSCRECPKRSGASPELFDDVPHADTCTDTSCFADKKTAHYQRIRVEAEAKGQTVITGKEAKEVMPNSWTLHGYKKLDETSYVDGKMKSLRKVLGKDMPTPMLLEDPSTHDMIEVLPTAVVGKLLKEKGMGSAKRDLSDSEAKHAALEKYEKTWRTRAIEQLYATADKDHAGGISFVVSRLLAKSLLGRLTQDERKHTSKLLGIGAVAEQEGLEAFIRECDDLRVEATLFLLLMQHDMRELVSYRTGKGADTPHIDALAHNFELDLVALKDDVKAEFKTAVREKAAAAAAKAKGAPAKPARKPRMSKADAPAAIAAAMQNAEPINAYVVGQRVRIKIDLRKGKDVFHTANVEAEIVCKTGDRAWELKPLDVAYTLIADYTEFEAVELEEPVVDGPDPLLIDAAALVRNEERASISMIQRHLRIGYNRAARLLEQLEAEGLVSAMDGSGARKVLEGDNA
ncbi:hypothetical protein BH11PSE13_BH11PSE13_12500 [soil metagenome]